MSIEALNAKMFVEQLVATKEAEAKEKAETAAKQAAGAKVGDVVVPDAPLQPANDPVASAKNERLSGGGVKRP